MENWDPSSDLLWLGMELLTPLQNLLVYIHWGAESMCGSKSVFSVSMRLRSCLSSERHNDLVYEVVSFHVVHRLIGEEALASAFCFKLEG